MSTTRHQVMESSLALGRLELAPSPAAAGVNLGPRPSGGAPAREMNGQPPPGCQTPAHLNGCIPLSHQVAGHKFGVDTVGILQHPDGTVLKQLQPPPRGPREMSFYSTVYADGCTDPCLLQLQKHLPKYYGTWSSPEKPKELYLKLEDVTRHFSRPCIMDVKLGRCSYDPYASLEKRQQQVTKYPLMEEIGFLVLGMRVYKVGSDSFDSYDQHYGRGLGKDTVKDGVARFFHNGAGLRRDAVAASIHRVRCILRWFQTQQQLAFYASSLLFVYEGLPSSSSSSTSSPAGGGGEEGEGQGGAELAECNNNDVRPYGSKAGLRGNGDTLEAAGEVKEEEEEEEEEGNSSWRRGRQPNGNAAAERGAEEGRGGGAEGRVEVRMIDFAHVFPSDSLDHGYVYGLEHLLEVLEEILQEHH